MPNKTKFGFGSSTNLEAAIQEGKLNARDVLFLDEDTDNPKIGWIKKSGEAVILNDEKTDLSEVEADIANLESALATKITADEVDAKIADKADIADVDAKIAAAMDEHLSKKYEIADVPAGTLVKIGEHEIRIMCPKSAVWTKQNVGAGGDANCYYMTFRTYSPDGAVGYKEHLGNQVDAEILTDLKMDEHGRKYQPTWLAIAKYDNATGAWSYYGASSKSNHYIGWDYQIDWFDADGVMIASDCIRINLSNEDCHYTVEPYYVSEVKTEVEAMVDEKIAGINSAYEIVEF